jgi:hypothetical protein
MVWRKALRDTRWRFAILFAVLVVLACGHVLAWLQVQTIVAKLGPQVAADDGLGGAISNAIAEQRTFRGYVWNQWFAANFKNCIVMFAAILGSGSVLSTRGHGLLFSLALPVSRGRWLGARAATGVAQVLVLALVPSFVLALLAPAVGESYAFADALVYGSLIFVLGAVAFALAVFVTALVDDFGRALVVTVLAAVAIAFAEGALPADHGLFAGLSGSGYFHSRTLPWPEIAVG